MNEHVFKKRACLIDLSRYRVPKFDRLKAMFVNLSSYGYNQIFFNIEHIYKIEKHPIIGSEADGFTDVEFKELDTFAYEECGIELIPVFQSFGHMYKILRWYEYSDLAESDMLWSLNISDDKIYDLLNDFYFSISKTFTHSKCIHVGGDEVYDMISDKSKHLLKEINNDTGKFFTKNELFLNHILKLKKIANSYEKEIIIWGDMIEKDEDVLKKLGKEVTICYWSYGHDEIPSTYIELMKSSNNRIYVCPGTNTWKSFFPRINFAKKNMKLRYQNSLDLKSYGFMVTDWGDAGHIHPISFTEKMFEMGAKIFDGEKSDTKLNLVNENNKSLNEIIRLLDKIHFGNNLNSSCTRNLSEYVTKHLFHEFVFNGKGFLTQTVAQLEALNSDIEELKVLYLNYSSNNGFKTEFELDLEMFISQTFLLGRKVETHLSFRNGLSYSLLKLDTEMFLTILNSWFEIYKYRWLKTSQPKGLNYHVHFIKQLEVDGSDELAFVKKKIGGSSSYDYNDIIEMKSIYEDDTRDEFKNIISVGNSAGLKALWEKFRL